MASDRGIQRGFFPTLIIGVAVLSIMLIAGSNVAADLTAVAAESPPQNVGGPAFTTHLFSVLPVLIAIIVILQVLQWMVRFSSSPNSSHTPKSAVEEAKEVYLENWEHNDFRDIQQLEQDLEEAWQEEMEVEIEAEDP